MNGTKKTKARELISLAIDDALTSNGKVMYGYAAIPSKREGGLPTLTYAYKTVPNSTCWMDNELTEAIIDERLRSLQEIVVSRVFKNTWLLTGHGENIRVKIDPYVVTIETSNHSISFIYQDLGPPLNPQAERGHVRRYG